MAFRFATCNEVFQDLPIADVLAQVREVGYAGIELAPFTLGADPVALSAAERSSLKKLIQQTGLAFVGLHWLLAAPEGLHATTPDKAVRERTWQYVDQFVDLCADLAGETGGLVVFGSPKQRSSCGGLSAADATEAFIEGIAKVAPHAQERGVTLLVEALSPDQSDVVTSLEKAVQIVRQINLPSVQTMFDVHNAARETEAHTTLIERYFPYIKHVHVNEMDGREPGMGDYDFSSLLRCLLELGYEGWVSLEAFDFSRDPKEIISRSLHRLAA